MCQKMCICIECRPFGFKDMWLYGHSNMLFSVYIYIYTYIYIYIHIVNINQS